MNAAPLSPRHADTLDRLKDGMKYAEAQMAKFPEGSQDRNRWQMMRQNYVNNIVKNFGFKGLPESVSSKEIADILLNEARPLTRPAVQQPAEMLTDEEKAKLDELVGTFLSNHWDELVDDAFKAIPAGEPDENGLRRNDSTRFQREIIERLIQGLSDREYYDTWMEYAGGGETPSQMGWVSSRGTP